MLSGLHAFASLVVAAGMMSAEPAGRDAAAPPSVRAAAAITGAEWRQTFAAKRLSYWAPRLVILRHPTGHPGAGTRYGSGVIVVDLNDLQRIAKQFDDSASTMVEIVVAHEFAHHVQGLLASQDTTAQPTAAGPQRELEADCLTGWIMGRINVRSRMASGFSAYALPSEDEMTALLAASLNERDSIETQEWISSHGGTSERLAAFRRGLRSTGFESCLGQRRQPTNGR